MMALVVDYLAPLMLVVGSFLCVTGAVGMLRFPDFFTRVHAASVTDTLGAGLILVALMLLSSDVVEVIKLVLILLFLLITGPTAVHALAKAAVTAGVGLAEQTDEVEIRSKGESSSKPS